MIRQGPPIDITVGSQSSGSAMDSRGDYPLSARGSSNNLTKNRFSFQQFGQIVGQGVDLTDEESIKDEFSWATG